MKQISLALSAVGFLLVAGCGSDDPTSFAVTGDWLAENMNNPDVQIVEAYQPPHQTIDHYNAGHIPGAVAFDVGSIRVTIDGVESVLETPEIAAAAFSAAGLRDDATIVVYDGNDGVFSARLLWSMRYYGHKDIRLLDGGSPAWMESGRAMIVEPAAFPATKYPVHKVRSEIMVDKDWVLGHLDDPSIVLLDVRSEAEWQLGYIPGAIHHDWHETLDNHLFKDDATLMSLLSLPSDKTIVIYCQTGTRASVMYAVLKDLGYSDVRVYDGSWFEWGVAPGVPIAYP